MRTDIYGTGMAITPSVVRCLLSGRANEDARLRIAPLADLMLTAAHLAAGHHRTAAAPIYRSASVDVFRTPGPGDGLTLHGRCVRNGDDVRICVRTVIHRAAGDTAAALGDFHFHAGG